MSLPPSRVAEKMMIRLPDGMRDKIAEAASVSGRSMNAEVIARLEASFAASNQPFTPEQEARVVEMVKDQAEAVVQRLMQEIEKTEREIAEEASAREAAKHS